MTLMFEDSRQKKGHIDMVFKRYDGRTKPIPCPENQEKRRAKGKYSSGKKKAKAAPVPVADPTPDDGVRKLLVRVTFKASKISTVVEPDAVPKFQEAYCKLVRNNMDGLKKEKKKKKAANTAKT